MKRLFASAIAALACAALATPASALTLQQAMDEVAGYYCSGSVCTTTVDGTRSETETRVVGYRSPEQGLAIEIGKSSVCFYGNGWPMINVSPITCASNSLMLGGGGSITQDFTIEIDTLTTISKELIYNGPNTSRDTAWSVNTTTETVDCPCN